MVRFRRGLTLLLGAALGLGGCNAVPHFAPGASLETEVQGRDVTLRWPAASGHRGYRITVNGRLIEDVGAEVQEYTIESLHEGESMLLAVGARGEHEDHVVASLMLPDVTPPRFPEGAELGVAIDGEMLLLSWEYAADDPGPVGYRVLFDGEVVASQDGYESPGRRMRMPVERPEVIGLVAVDDAGNRSEVLTKALAEAAVIVVPEPTYLGPGELDGE